MKCDIDFSASNRCLFLRTKTKIRISNAILLSMHQTEVYFENGEDIL